MRIYDIYKFYSLSLIFKCAMDHLFIGFKEEMAVGGKSTKFTKHLMHPTASSDRYRPDPSYYRPDPLGQLCKTNKHCNSEGPDPSKDRSDPFNRYRGLETFWPNWTLARVRTLPRTVRTLVPGHTKLTYKESGPFPDPSCLTEHKPYVSSRLNQN